MKKSFVCFLSLCLLLTTTFMTSCLGDSESSFDTSGLIYVDYSPERGGWYGYHPYPGAGFISFEGLDKYERGSVISVSYKVYLDRMNSYGVYPAENVLVDENQIYKSFSQPTVKMKQAAPEANIDNSFLGYNLFSYEPSDNFGDRWVFSYKAQRVGDQTLNVEFYYDVDKQNYGDNTSETSDNTVSIEKGGQMVVLDVRLRKGTTSSTDKKDVSGVTIANFSDLRSYIRYTVPTKNTVYIAFRYNTIDSNGDLKENYTRPYNYCGMYWPEAESGN